MRYYKPNLDKETLSEYRYDETTSTVQYCAWPGTTPWVSSQQHKTEESLIKSRMKLIRDEL